MTTRERDYSLDLVRIVALTSVVSVHFFRNCGYYTVDVLGKEMLVATLLRTYFMVCVPLFIILTGYLMRNKKLSVKYYLGIKRTAVIYVLVGIVCLLFRKFGLGHNITFESALFSILNYTASLYGWYMEMYIGLFLLIPFLNLMYGGLNGKKQKQWLIATFLILTALPSVLNIYNFTVPGWWWDPQLSGKYMKIVPSWWVVLYPITYYFIGCYLGEYKVEIKKGFSFLLIVIFTLIFGLFNYYRSYGGVFVWGAYQDWGSVQNTVLAVLTFVFISSLDLSGIPGWIKKLLVGLSGSCFGAYLISYIFDEMFYPILNAAFPMVYDRFIYFPLIVLAVAVCSLASSMIISFIYGLIEKGIGSIPRNKNKKELANVR